MVHILCGENKKDISHELYHFGLKKLKLKPTRSMGGYTVGYSFFLREVALLMWRVLPHANVPPLFRGGHGHEMAGGLQVLLDDTCASETRVKASA